MRKGERVKKRGRDGVRKRSGREGVRKRGRNGVGKEGGRKVDEAGG